ncbi:MAG: hypothetical protein J0H35_12265, partial [Rhodospirillales bacterium]|nr:hypothetical protein [Rhodospirillales bacterium]
YVWVPGHYVHRHAVPPLAALQHRMHDRSVERECTDAATETPHSRRAGSCMIVVTTDHAAHDPDAGAPLEGRRYWEVPARADALLQTVRAAGHQIVPHGDRGLDPISRLHDAGYLRFLKDGFATWRQEGGVGLLTGIEMVQDKASRKLFDPARKVGALVDAHARKHGLITRFIGDRIAFSPPLIITEAEVDEVAVRVGRALDDTWAELRAA